jgi:large subunit ribosomal protein L15
MAMKLKRRRKSSRMHGKGMGSHGWGARKKHISSGNRGGFGMSGTGKMAGHKKTLITKLYGMGYFGKQGLTSRGSKRKHDKTMNISEIVLSLEKFKKQYGEKDGTLNFKGYKILAEGETTLKLKIKAKAASKSAIEKIEKAGGQIILEKLKSESESDEGTEKEE